MTGLIILNILAKIADHATTRLVLGRGCVERNPVAWGFPL